MVAFENKGAMAATIVVAASDSLNKAAANYVCDGVADNVKIQAAIDALPAGGGRVLLLDGNYEGGKITIIKSRVTLEGQGRSTRYKLAAASNSHIIEVGDTISNYADIHIKNLYLDGNKANQGVGNWSGVYFRWNPADRAYYRIENVEVYNADYQGISSEADIDILYCKVDSSGDTGIWAGVPNTRIIGNNVVSPGGQGIQFWAGANATGYLIIKSNAIDSTTKNSIALTYPPTNFIVEGNSLTNSPAVYAAMDIQHAVNGRVIGNYCKTHYTGIQMLNDSHDMLIEGNEVVNCHEHSIIVATGCYKVDIIGNSVLDGGADTDPWGWAGIHITNGYQITVVGNRIENIQGKWSRGINISGTYNTVVGNSIKTVTQRGIAAGGSYCTFNDNTIIDSSVLTNNYGQGIYITGSRNTVIGNVVYDLAANKSQYNIQESGSDYNIIEANNVSGAVTAAIVRVGANTIVRDNVGYKTENSGTAAVLNTTTSIVVNHGLATTPTRVIITPRENPTNAVSFWWVDTLTATQFTIHVNTDPGASNLDFDWHAQVGEG